MMLLCTITGSLKSNGQGQLLYAQSPSGARISALLPLGRYIITRHPINHSETESMAVAQEAGDDQVALALAEPFDQITAHLEQNHLLVRADGSPRYSAQLDALTDEMGEAIIELQVAAKVFRDYEAQHRAKAHYARREGKDKSGEDAQSFFQKSLDSDRKADRNKEHAERIEKLLETLEAGRS